MSEKQNSMLMSAGEAAFHFPPPSYEEVMGVYQTSVKGQEGPVVQDLPPLAYLDIMPRCISPGNIKGKVKPKFENFSSIMAGTNMWLRDNPGYRVWKCESIERKLDSAHDGSLSYELIDMLQHESIFGYIVYIRGLRLWLMKNTSPSASPQVLGVQNMEPTKMTIELPTRGYYRQGRVIIGEEVVQSFGYNRSFDTFVGLQDTISNINKQLASNPIPGSILTIETDNVKAYEGFSKDLDPDATCWSEDKIKFRRVTQVVRIFYVTGPPVKEVIGVNDVEPEVLHVGSSIQPPKLGAFQSTVDKINQWLPANQDKRIVNIQQFDAKMQSFMGNVTISSDSTDEIVTSHQTRNLARVIRLFTVMSTTQKASPTVNYVTSRLFLPARTGNKSFENMNQTMDRIDAWLRVTGLPIYNVETVRYLFNVHQPDGADVTKAQYSLQGNSGKDWITGIRVYFPCRFEEPDPSLLPPPPPQLKSSSSCNVL